MRAFRAIRSSFARRPFHVTGTQLSFAGQLLIPGLMDHSVHEWFLQPLLAADKEEAKAVLTLFLKKQGFSNAVAARTVNKSALFIDHLVSKVHSVHKSRHLVGREFTNLEIRDALIPYLESLLEEHGQAGNILADVVENFPNPPVKGKPIMPVTPPLSTLKSSKLKAVSHVSETGPVGELRPQILYLLELGMDLEQIKKTTRRHPPFSYYSLEGKIKPLVKFLLDLGAPKSHIATILSKSPQLCGLSLPENLIPTMMLLESLGVDKKRWAKIIYRCPPLLTFSKQKFQSTVDFLHEMGLSEESIGKVLTRFPNILCCSVQDKLWPTAEYFRSLGVGVAVLLQQSPETFGLSIEASLKPKIEFFLEKGYRVDEVATMISKFGAIFTVSLVGNVIPKWEFFLTLDYPISKF